jgi:hypothetical protein
MKSPEGLGLYQGLSVDRVLERTRNESDLMMIANAIGIELWRMQKAL